MGANFSSKDTKINKIGKIIKHQSCDVLDEDSKLNQNPKPIPTSRSFNNCLPTQEEHLKSHFSISSSGSDSSTEHSCNDVTENQFIQKTQRYLRSIEDMGEISDLKFFFGHLILTTEDGKYSVAVREADLGEDIIITLESEVDRNDTIVLYTYTSSVTGLAQKYTYFSLLYIKNVLHSNSRNYILQANMNTPHGQPTFIPRRIRVPDNPKLVSPYSRFIGTMLPQGFIRTMILFLSNSMQPFYVAQSDMSLAFTTNEVAAGIFTLV